MALNEDNTLGEWASSYAGASFVFIKNKLNFCCGGEQTLQESCEKNGISTEHLIAEVKKVSEDKTTPEWNNLSLQEVIDEILEKYHKKHRQDLATLIPLAKKVERVHVNNEESPQGLSNFLTKLLFELESHMKKEEQVLFPMIKSGKGFMAGGPINVMMQEHVGHGEQLAFLRRLAKNYEFPKGACHSWRALYQGVATLERELMEHIAIENSILFPKALNG